MGDRQTSPAGLRQGCQHVGQIFRTDTALRHIPAIKRTRQIAFAPEQLFAPLHRLINGRLLQAMRNGCGG